MTIYCMWAAVVSFFNHPFFVVVGGSATLIMVIGFIYTVWLVIRGLVPVWIRLGIGLSKRKIAIFATSECENLVELIEKSKLFPPRNIVCIGLDSISKANDEKCTIYLVCWNDFKSHMERILSIKAYSTALIVYAPHKGGDVDKLTMDRINEEPNSTIVRFRGRLLNDILTSILTTSYGHN